MVDYARKALYHALKSKDDSIEILGYRVMAEALGMDKAINKDVEDNLLKALSLARKSHTAQIAPSTLDLAHFYKRTGNYEAMPNYLREAEANFGSAKKERLNNEIRLDILWGDYFFSGDSRDLSKDYYAKAYKKILSIGSQLMFLDFLPRYAKFLRAQDKSDLAFDVYMGYQKFNDSIQGLSKETDVRDAMANVGAEELRNQRNDAEFEKRLADQELKRKNLRYILLSILTCFLILFIFFMIIFLRIRKRLINDLRCKNGQLIVANEISEKNIKAKNDFFSTVSHEMRTPLYGVTGMINVLMNSKASEGFMEEFQSLQFSADHLLKVINDLLELSKLDDKSFEMNAHPFSLTDLSNEIINSFSKSPIKLSNTLHLDLGKFPSIFIGDSRRIAQVLINLISNALKFTENGHIYLEINSLDVTDAQVEVHFEVRDTGKGIPQDSLRSIFDEFSQIEEVNIEQKKGTGLGLAIVSRILLKMGSSINVKSEEGKGSTFSFDLVLQRPDKKPFVIDSLILSQNWEEDREEVLKGKEVLIVDDNRINILVTRKLLEKRGMQIDTASNGYEVLDLLNIKTYDVILMDLHMPLMDGFETTSRIRETDMATRIIALTASDVSQMKERLNDTGFNDFISKPFDPENFYKMIAKNLMLQNA